MFFFIVKTNQMLEVMILYSEQEKLKMIYVASSEVAELYREIVGKLSVVEKVESGTHRNSRMLIRADYCKRVLPGMQDELKRCLDKLLDVYIDAQSGFDMVNID